MPMAGLTPTPAIDHLIATNARINIQVFVTRIFQSIKDSCKHIALVAKKHLCTMSLESDCAVDEKH